VLLQLCAAQCMLACGAVHAGLVRSSCCYAPMCPASVLCNECPHDQACPVIQWYRALTLSTKNEKSSYLASTTLLSRVKAVKHTHSPSHFRMCAGAAVSESVSDTAVHAAGEFLLKEDGCCEESPHQCGVCYLRTGEQKQAVRSAGLVMQFQTDTASVGKASSTV
jgi:hypothetical protein